MTGEPAPAGNRAAGVANTVSGGIQVGPVLQGRDFRDVNIDVIVRAAAAAPTALAQLPAAVAGFTGREDELAVLAGLLNPAGTGGPVVVSAVAGLAGVGKTTLAIHAGHAAVQAGWFSGGVLFIDLHGYDDQPVESARALDALLRALGVPAEHIPPGTEERAGLYRSMLAQMPGPVLVVADNASAEAQVRPLVPGTGPHKVLVTSRHTLARLGARLVDLTILDDKASIDLLDAALRAARPGDDRITASPEATQRLTRVCGGLPLALQITAALLIANPALTTADLAGELVEESGRLGRLAYDDGSGPGAPSVAAVFESSYCRLDDTAARVFRLLPVNPGPDVSTAAAAALAGLPEGEVRGVLGALVRAHLAEPAPGGRWRMHDLVCLYGRQLSDDHAEGDGREEARDRLLGYYVSMAKAAAAYLPAPTGTATAQEFTGWDAAMAWLDAERASLVAAVTMAADSGRDQVALRLPLAMASYLAWRRRFDEWQPVAAVSLSAARRLGDQTGVGVALNNLGTALGQARRFDEAIAAHQESLTIYRDIRDRRREAVTLGNLGLAFQGARRFEDAITTHQESLAIFRETGNRHDEGMALNNLGIALQLARRFGEAIAACQDAAAIHRETGDPHGEATVLGNLGSALLEARRFGEAIAAYEAAAATYRATGDRQGEGSASNNLGAALRQARRFEEAIIACQDAAVIYRETSDRHGEGSALNNLSIALQDVRRFEEAITACQAAAVIYRETGDRHSEGSALNNLGLALWELRRFDEAIAAYQAAAAIYRQTGDRHGEGDALTNHGVVLQEARRFEEAITTHQAAAAAYRETGDRHGEGTALNNLAIALQELQRFGEAILACQDAAAIYRQTGDQHAEASALTNLGAAFYQVRWFGEAITAYQAAAAIYRQTRDRHGEGSALCNLGLALKELRRFGEAITACQDAADSFRQTGDRHREGMALNNLGLALKELRRFDEAITACQDAADIFRETGDRHGERIAIGNLEAARAAQQT